LISVDRIVLNDYMLFLISGLIDSINGFFIVIVNIIVKFSRYFSKGAGGVILFS